MARTLDAVSEEFRTFWTERHLASLVTLRADGSPHVVPVGVTLDVEAGLARVICRGGSVKARNAAARGDRGRRPRSTGGAGPRWRAPPWCATEAAAVAEAVRRYALRYRQPRPNPERVVIEIAVRRVLGLT